MLVQSRGQLMPRQCFRHFEGASQIHIGGDDRNTLVAPLRVEEDIVTRNIDLGTRCQRRPLGADEHILEIELKVLFNSHVTLLYAMGWVIPDSGGNMAVTSISSLAPSSTKPATYSAVMAG